MSFFFENRNNEPEIQKRDHLAFRAHFHSHIELVYLIKGSAHAFSAGKECMLAAGDFFIAFPNTVHYYDDCSDEIEVLIAIVPYALFPEYKKTFTELLPKQPKICGVDTDAVLLFHKATQTEGPYKNEIIRAYLSAIFGMLFSVAEFEKGIASDDDSVQQLVSYLRRHYRENITLDDVSRALFISKSRISHIFGEKLHISFRSFINGLRLADAEQLLLNGKFSITEIAMQVGYENVRTFNRKFLEHYSCSPREYKKIKKEKNA